MFKEMKKIVSNKRASANNSDGDHPEDEGKNGDGKLFPGDVAGSEIDAENFSLGEGPMDMKKKRLDRFVNRLVDNENLFKAFKGKKNAASSKLKSKFMSERINPEI